MKPDAHGRFFWLPCGYDRVDITDWLFSFEVHGVKQQLSWGQIASMHPDLYAQAEDPHDEHAAKKDG